MTHWGFVLSPRSGILVVVDVVELLVVVDVVELLVVVDVVEGLKTPTPGASPGRKDDLAVGRRGGTHELVPVVDDLAGDVDQLEGLGGRIEDTHTRCVTGRKDDLAVGRRGGTHELVPASADPDVDQLEGLVGRIEDTHTRCAHGRKDDLAVGRRGGTHERAHGVDLVGDVDQLEAAIGRIYVRQLARATKPCSRTHTITMVCAVAL